MNSRASRFDTIFCAAIEIPSAGDRADFIASTCGDDEELRSQLERLVEAHFRAGNFLEEVTPSSGAATKPPIRESAGSFVGPYKLRKQIGEGGMGTVFMAEQTQPIARNVALKIIRPGMDSRQVVSRFEVERQALAMMDHPNIAKVLDAGTTGTGRPYFVMELVKGVPITQYCDVHRLTPRQRLELLIPVCQAVQHAHQKGIIHRDLKPSNVIVALYDGKAVPKVIDFGVAKATGTKLTEQTLFTAFGQVIGTLEYMSPEQSQLNQLDIDTRTDIYSLGVQLYELLTGSTPLESKRMKYAALLDALRIIRDEEPERPSTRLSGSKQLTSIAASRGLDPKQLRRQVRGELDWIVMKCLEKDRNRRYETADGLARDLERYLRDEPVQACPPSRWYRARKFARRNKVPVLAVALVLLALVAGTVGTTLGLIATERHRAIAERARIKEADQRALAVIQRNVAEKARNRAREALDAMTSMVTNDSLMTQSEISAEQKRFLAEVLTYYQEFAGEQAKDELSRRKVAAAAYRVGFIDSCLGRTGESMAAFEKARAEYDSLLKQFPANTEYRQELAKTHNQLGHLFKNLDEYTQALLHHRSAVVLLEHLATGYSSVPFQVQELARAHYGLGMVLAAMWKQPEAEEQYRSAMALQTQLVVQFPTNAVYRQELGRIHNSLGILLKDRGKFDQAEEQYGRAIEIRQKLADEFPAVAAYRQELATSYHCRGVLLHDRQQYSQAEELYRNAVMIRQRLADEFPGRPVYRHELARSHDYRAKALHALKKYIEGEEPCRKALALRLKLVADFPARPVHRQDLASSYINLGVLFHGRQQVAQAEEQVRRGVVLLEKLAAEFPTQADYRQCMAAAYVLEGNLLRELGNDEEAEPHYRKAVGHLETLLAEFPTMPAILHLLSRSHTCLGKLLRDQGKHREAEKEFRKALVAQGDLGASRTCDAPEGWAETEEWKRLVTK